MELTVHSDPSKFWGSSDLNQVKLVLPKLNDAQITSATFFAVSNGNLDVLSFLLDFRKEKHRPHSVDHLGFTLMKRACQNGHLEIAKFLHNRGESIHNDPARSQERTACYLAAQNGHLEVLKWLVENGADPKVEVFIFGSPLLIACQEGKLEIVQYLVSLGCDFKNPTIFGFGQTPLSIAVERGRTEVVKYLVAIGSDFMASISSRLPAYLVACSEGKLELLDFFYSRAKTEFDSNTKMISIASKHGQLSIIKWLVSKNLHFPNEPEPLLKACEHGRTETAQYLLSLGFDPNASDPAGRTALYFASKSGRLEIVQDLLKRGASKEPKNDLNALHAACTRGSLEVVKYLIEEQGFDPHERSADNSTSMMFATTSGNEEILRYLHSIGVNVKFRKSNGVAPIHVAALTGQLKILEFLCSVSDPNYLTDDGRTPLGCACASSHGVVAHSLICFGATIGDESKFSPIRLAESAHRDDIVQYLKRLKDVIFPRLKQGLRLCRLIAGSGSSPSIRTHVLCKLIVSELTSGFLRNRAVFESLFAIWIDRKTLSPSRYIPKSISDFLKNETSLEDPDLMEVVD